MEPVTHILTGAVLARAGLHRKTACAALAMAIAAEFPDIDTLWSLGGPVTGFAHHRGITHTFVGVPVEAALITGAFLFYDRLRKPRKRPPPAPLRWPWLFPGTLLALLSHLLLDWTNNYGIRPFFPFNPQWYAGSFVFIFEPLLFALLLGALVLPSLFGLINAEVGARRRAFVSPAWSWVALVLIAALYGGRYFERTAAIRQVEAASPDADHVFASPFPGNPFLWSVLAESPDRYALATVDTRKALDPALTWTIYKPETSPASESARRTYLGRVYLDWSMFPVINVTPDLDDPRHPLQRVTYADARFLYDAAFLHGRTNPPLSGWVLLDMQAPEGQRVVETWLGGREQR